MARTQRQGGNRIGTSRRSSAIVGLGLLATLGGMRLPSTPGGREGPDTTGPSVRTDSLLEPVRRAPTSGEESFEAARASFPLHVNGRTIPYRVLAVTVLPGETLRLRLPGGAGGYRLVHATGHASTTMPDGWTWTAPGDPGIQPLRILAPGERDSIHLNVLVLHPRSRMRDGWLKGFVVGRYPESPLRGDSVYLPPRGFAELEDKDADVLVSPHFALGQFRCKQPGAPSYLALSVPLVLKLEAVLEEVNAAGYPVSTLHVMSGYRTPAYNRAIGNRTSYSRHLWGDAADVFVDADGDGVMDDVNGDGRGDATDARWLARLVERVEAVGGEAVTPGGLSVYRATRAHGPFVHLDARGRRARW